MAIITRQQKIFNWDEVEKLGDLQRLKLVVEYMPDERLMQHFKRECFRGRDDYPVRAMWNSILAGIVYQPPKHKKPVQGVFAKPPAKKSVWI